MSIANHKNTDLPLHDLRRSVSQIITININLLGACLLTGIAWLMWAEDGSEGLLFRLFSFILLCNAFAFFIKACKEIFKQRERDLALDEFERLGRQVKGAKLVSDTVLKEKGLIR